MSKILILKCIDGEKEYEYDVAKIYTKKYTRPLKRSSLHTPRAAKIIFSVPPMQTILLVKMPIIYVDSRNKISIFTQSTLEEALLLKKYNFSEVTKRDIKIKSKLLHIKERLGLTKFESLLQSTNKYNQEMVFLIDSLEEISEGGGFNPYENSQTSNPKKQKRGK